MKKGIIFLEAALIVIVLLFVVLYRNEQLEERRYETVSALALEVSENIYLGDETYYVGIASNEALETIRETIQSVRGRELRTIAIYDYTDKLKEDNEIVVIVRVFEEPFNRTVFHRIIFVPVDDEWMVRAFAPET